MREKNCVIYKAFTNPTIWCLCVYGELWRYMDIPEGLKSFLEEKNQKKNQQGADSDYQDWCGLKWVEFYWNHYFEFIGNTCGHTCALVYEYKTIWYVFVCLYTRTYANTYTCT